MWSQKGGNREERSALVELQLKPLKQVRLENVKSSYVFQSGRESSINFSIAADEKSIYKSKLFKLEISTDAQGISIDGKNAFYGVMMEANEGESVRIPLYVWAKDAQLLMRLSLVRVQEEGRVLFDEKMATIVARE